MALDKNVIRSISESGLTDDALASVMQNDLEVTKENNRSAENIKAQDIQDKNQSRYHLQCIVAFVGVFGICGGLLVLSYQKPDLDSNNIVTTISTLIGIVFGFVAGKKI